MFNFIQIPIGKTANGNTLPLPTYKSDKSTCMELYAAIPNRLRIKPGTVEYIKTGVGVGLPKGYQCVIQSNYQRVLDDSIVVLGSPLIIDGEYKDEIIIPVENKSKETLVINRGDVIASMSVFEVSRAIWQEV